LTENLLAARRGNITHVLIPKENERDLAEVSPKIRKSIKIDLVEHVDEVLRVALVVGEGESVFKELPMDSFCGDVILQPDDTVAHH